MIGLVNVQIRRQKASRKITFHCLVHIEYSYTFNREYILKNSKNDYDSCMFD